MVVSSEIPTRVVAVALCSDARMEIPLHVAATSVLQNLSPDFAVRFYLMLDGVEVGRLRKSLDKAHRPYEIVPLPIPNASTFSRLRPFFGGHAAYYRLLLPDMIQESRFLYLDTDTVTKIDVAPLFSIDMEGHAMGFVVDGRVKSVLESRFFLSLGMKEDDPMFNSGVMLVDVQQWHRENCFARIMQFCTEHANDLMTADQTALNALFAQDCFHLNPIFNIKLSAVVKEGNPKTGIFHFVGNPKPWDLFGSMLHPYYALWDSAVQKTALGLSSRSFLNLSSWTRLPDILGGYRRVLRQRVETRKKLR